MTLFVSLLLHHFLRHYRGCAADCTHAANRSCHIVSAARGPCNAAGWRRFSCIVLDETALFPGAWGDYGDSAQEPVRRRAPRRLFAANYVSATVLLGVLAITMIWLP
jgi:hypothetical protein